VLVVVHEAALYSYVSGGCTKQPCVGGHANHMFGVFFVQITSNRAFATAHRMHHTRELKGLKLPG
jgi:hypothetical protein